MVNLSTANISDASKAVFYKGPPAAILSLLPYLGGKQKVALTLGNLRPCDSIYENIFDIFMGGGSIPLTLFNHYRLEGKLFHGRDAYLPTVAFWKSMCECPEALAERVEGLMGNFSSDSRALYLECLRILRQDSAGILAEMGAAYYIYVHLVFPQAQFLLADSAFSTDRANEWLKKQGRAGELLAWAKVAHGWDIRQQDFRATMAEVIAHGSSAFAFIDPPYEVKTKACNDNGALLDERPLYGQDFTASDQDDLAGLVHQATKAGCKCMVTLNYSTKNMERYAGLTQIVRTHIYGSHLKGKESNRGVELVILNYDPPFASAEYKRMGWVMANDYNPANSL